MATVEHKRKKGEEGFWAVYDDNAKIPDSAKNDGSFLARRHESRPGRHHPLYADRACLMPEADARVFLKDPAFRVYNVDDEFIPPLNSMASLRVMPDILPRDIVLASLDELTAEALLTRAAQRPDGHRFSEQTAREVLVRFLLEGNDSYTRDQARIYGLAGPVTGGAGEALEVDDMDEDSAKRMLEGA